MATDFQKDRNFISDLLAFFLFFTLRCPLTSPSVPLCSSQKSSLPKPSPYCTGRTSSHTHDPQDLPSPDCLEETPREGVKVGVSSSSSAFTGLPLIGDAVSSERTAVFCLWAFLVLWRGAGLGRILRGLRSLNGCFSAMCGVPFCSLRRMGV